MAARLPLSQVPAMFARRQPTVLRASRRLQSSSAPQTQNPAYPLYPSVIQLLHEKNIPESEISKIPASGPKGRLLKGDVLAYIGQIGAEYPANQAATLAKLTYLDLSNIKIAAPAPKPAAPAAEEKKAEVAQPAPMSSIAISISLSAVLSAQKKIQESLGVTVPLSRFLAIATDLANDDLPRAKSEKPSSDELFEELLGAEPVKTSRGDYIPELNAFEASEARQPEPVVEDIIDFLSAKPGKKTVASSVSAVEGGAAQNVFSLTVPVSEELRAKTFLERIKTLLQVEPARLVL
ncbi:pyruvate dehydrogenase complex component Pdx1 [Penicillium brasilianum]|uniref:Pyruvate dehydrogenase complex component Pdx1 n=1 Tax=Penicillium brasilianum TaxID=104259 RepID=A0A1S9R892_PENBI|nr:pyruvate dehydrogenase complex component Pdx1 [Penicillium brasilianum]